MLVDIDKETVDFMPNFDDSLKEPLVLPTRLPNLLVNGSSGIAVGMATNIPPHNLNEICTAIDQIIDNPDISVDDLIRTVKGPDFPTAGIILGQEGIRSAYATGHGKVVVRARASFEEAEDVGSRRKIIVTELPYQTNKAALVERIAELSKDRKISGISELRDESDREGMRIVIELKRDAQPEQVLNNLYKHTSMQSAFFVNMVALVENQPRVLSLKEALQAFIDFRHNVITRRSRYDMRIAKEREHILQGFKKALDLLDEIIKTIRESENADDAKLNLIKKFDFSPIQAQAILDLQLRRLAHLERQKILDELAEVIKTINYLEDLLANPKKIYFLIKQDMKDLRNKYGDERRTEIQSEEARDFNEEDLIPKQRVVVTLSNRGYVKTTPLVSFRLQHRGGKGALGMKTREEDDVKLLVVADNHDQMLFFTNRGRVFSIKCYKIPQDVSRLTRGTAAINLFPISENEKVASMVPISDYNPSLSVLLITASGEIKRLAITNFESVRSSGLIAMDVEKDDELVAARLATDENEIIIVTQQGQSIRFPVAELRTSLRTSGGVKGMRLSKEDLAVSMDVLHPNSFALTVTANGFGKLTPIQAYPRQHRAGSGVRTFHITDKTGVVAAAKLVLETEQVMIITAEGFVINTLVKERDPKLGITIQGRSTQGVRLMKLDEGDRVVAVASFDREGV
jgi:DNA gyrase subunit A